MVYTNKVLTNSTCLDDFVFMGYDLSITFQEVLQDPSSKHKNAHALKAIVVTIAKCVYVYACTVDFLDSNNNLVNYCKMCNEEFMT